MQIQVGIDLGGTLVKMLFMSDDNLLEQKLNNLHSHSWKLKTLLNTKATSEKEIHINKTSPPKTNSQKQQPTPKKNQPKTYFFYFLEPRSENDSLTIRSILKQLNQEKLFIQLGLTGGGAKSLQMDLEEEMYDPKEVKIKGINEIVSIVNGLKIIEKYFPHHFLKINSVQSSTLSQEDSLYPLTLVNIGSGSSVVHIDEEQEFSRLGGTCIGASTFMGLSVLSNCSVSNEFFSLPEKGNFSNFINDALFFFEGLGNDTNLKSLQKEFDSTESGAFELHMLTNILRENIRMGFYGAINKKCKKLILAGSIFCILTDFDERFHLLMKRLIQVIVDGTCLEMEAQIEVMVLQSSGLLGAFSSLK